MNNKFQNIDNKNLISNYGRVLRKKVSDKVIIELDEGLGTDFDFQLNRIDDLVKEFNGFMPPNRMSHYILAFITHGNGRKTIGQYSFNINSSMALLFPKKIIHSTNKWSLDTKGYMLTFNENFFTGSNFPLAFLSLPSLFKLSRTPYYTADKNISSRIISIFEDLFSLEKSVIRFNSELLVLKVAELVMIYKSLFENDTASEGSKYLLYDRFVELVELHFRKEKSVRFYADSLSVHPNHLNFIVKKQSGYTAKIYILNRIFLEAKYLLSSSSVPIKEISFDLGFLDYNHFCRYFKLSANITPQQYRESFI